MGGEWKLLKAGILKLESASQSSGGLVKTQVLVPPPGFLIKWSGVAPTIYISNKFQSEADASGLGTTSENRCPRARSSEAHSPGSII